MGRIVRRVPIDFSWPIRQVYDGYVRPGDLRSIPCPKCEGTGKSQYHSILEDRWYGKSPFHPSEKGSTPFLPSDPTVRAIVSRKVNLDEGTRDFYERMTGATGERMVTREAMRMCALWNAGWQHHLDQDDVDVLVAEGRLTAFTHDWIQGEGWKPKNPPYVPTAKEVNLWSLDGFGHDGINQWIVTTAEAQRHGLDRDCPDCEDGRTWRDEEHRKAFDAWQSQDPPEGDGWQMWETVSEGSPTSPVFGTPDALADWLSVNDSAGNTASQWMATILDGWAPTMVGGQGWIATGVAAAELGI